MKYIQFSYFAMFVCVIAIFISGCRHSEPSEVIVKDALGFYHIDGNPESLDLKMSDGGIVFSRKKAFHIGVVYTGKEFSWHDDGKDFFIYYNGKIYLDFNRDFIFDLSCENKQYYIHFNGKFIEVNKPDFQAMRAVDLDGTNYHWNGSNWLKRCKKKYRHDEMPAEG